MAYQKDKPAATDRLSVSQADIQGNFQALNNVFNGLNNFITLPVQLSAPTTSATQMALYTQTSAVTSKPEMVIERDTNGTKIEFTTIQPSFSVPGPAGSVAGWTRLPSGLVIKWGKQIMNTVNPISINLNGIGPTLSAAYMAQLTSIIVGFQFVVNSLTASTLSVRVTGGSLTDAFYWIVFGTE